METESTSLQPCPMFPGLSKFSPPSSIFSPLYKKILAKNIGTQHLITCVENVVTNSVRVDSTFDSTFMYLCRYGTVPSSTQPAASSNYLGTRPLSMAYLGTRPLSMACLHTEVVWFCTWSVISMTWESIS